MYGKLKLLLIFTIVALLNVFAYAIDLQNIPPELLEKAKQNPELIQNYLKDQNTQSTKNAVKDENVNIKSEKTNDIVPTVEDEKDNLVKSDADNKTKNTEYSSEQSQEKTIYLFENKFEGKYKNNIKNEYETAFDKLKIFGSDIFNANFAYNLPDQNVNVDDDYTVGAGDTINIYLWGRMTKIYNVPVENDGTIFINEIGKIQVGGKRLGEVKKIVQGYINSIEGVHGSVSIGSLKSIRVLVVGEVKNPGFQTISNLSTVTGAIAKAGGITNIADIRDVVVKRNGKVVANIDYYNLILNGDTTKDIYLQPNDVIFIQRTQKMVYLAGNVKKPAIYVLKGDESLSRLIKYAGGLTADGYSKQIHIKRVYNDKPSEVYDITLEQAEKFSLKDGDKVFVASITKPEEDSVFLYGEVYFPGRYSLKNNKTLIDLIKDKSNLKPEASLDYGYIKRLNAETKEYIIIPFNINEAFDNPSNAQNITLHPLDEVYVVNKYDVMPKNIVEIKGEVRNPGKYQIEDKVTLYDAINKAGGLTTDASKGYIEIVRKGEGKFYTRFVSYEKAKDFYLEVDDKIVVHAIWERNLKKYVKIEGEVNSPGTYLLTDNMTLGDLIIKAGGITKDAYLDIFHLYRLNETDFNYKLFTLNLKKDLTFILNDRDEVVIHNFREFHPVKSVQILGEVNKPGTFNYADNMTLSDLIIAAGNVKDSAYLDRVEIVRMKVEAGKTEYSVVDVNLNNVLAGGKKVYLKPFDVVKIRKISEYKKEDKVVVSGEAYFPGEFVIRKGEKLADVIQRAGGITEYGYIKNLIFKRKSVREIQKKRIKELKDRLQSTLLSISSKEIASSLSTEDIAAQKSLQANLEQTIKNLDLVEPEGRVVVKVQSFEDLKNSQYNFELEDGDEIIIPKKPSTVNVVGEVYNSTSFVFTDKEPTVEYYINACGGLTDLASEDDIFVVKGDGSVISKRFIEKNYWWKDIYDVKLEPGDTVVIPRKLVFPNYMRDIKDITQILYQIATTVAVTKVLF